MNQQRIRVLIADDSAVVRRALSELVAAQPDMEVLDTAATGHEAVRRAIELQPDIVFMDIHMPDMDGIQAAWLVSNKAPHGAVIMVTSEDRIDFLQKAMAAGAQGYILKPFGDGTALLETARDVYQRSSARQIPIGAVDAVPSVPGPRLGRRIAMFGAKGGVGKTSLAVGLALILRQTAECKTVLFDADLLFGDANIHLDLIPERTIIDLVPHVDALDSRLVQSVIARHPSGVHLLARPPRPEQADIITAEHIRAILSILATLYEFTLVDLHSSYDERMLAALDLADLYIVMVSPDLGSLLGTRHFLDIAKTLGYSEDRMCFVLSRADSLAGLPWDDIASVLGTRRILQIPSVGSALSESINRGAPLVINDPRGRYARAVAAVADHVRVLA